MVNFGRRPRRSAICKKKKKKKEESVLLGDRNRHIPMARDVPSSCFIPQTKGGLHYDYEYRFGAKFYC